jgi:hypothetical protein
MRHRGIRCATVDRGYCIPNETSPAFRHPTGEGAQSDRKSGVVRASSMSLQVAQVVVSFFELYALAGVAFAVLFLPRGVVHLDPRVAGAPRTLRLLILPGVAALWPVFVRRWLGGAQEPVERNPHRDNRDNRYRAPAQ